jgi:hypothetical protein
MAFVSRAERKFQAQSSSNLGPGTYISHSSYASNPSFAPFASTSERKFLKQAAPTLTPGPGAYINATPTEIAKSIDYWGNSKSSPAFASLNARFRQKKPSESPGPGSYSLPDQWHGQKARGKSSGTQAWARVPSAPSIPANHQTFGYDETTTGEFCWSRTVQLGCEAAAQRGQLEAGKGKPRTV